MWGRGLGRANWSAGGGIGAWPEPWVLCPGLRLASLLSPRPAPAAQMVITDLTAPAERPAALSRLGLCFGVGMILGSLLGGTLSTAYG